MCRYLFLDIFNELCSCHFSYLNFVIPLHFMNVIILYVMLKKINVFQDFMFFPSFSTETIFSLIKISPYFLFLLCRLQYNSIIKQRNTFESSKSRLLNNKSSSTTPSPNMYECYTTVYRILTDMHALLILTCSRRGMVVHSTIGSSRQS